MFAGPEGKNLHGDVVAVYRSVFTGPPPNDSDRDVGWFDEDPVPPGR